MSLCRFRFEVTVSLILVTSASIVPKLLHEVEGNERFRFLDKMVLLPQQKFYIPPQIIRNLVLSGIVSALSLEGHHHDWQELEETFFE